MGVLVPDLTDTHTAMTIRGVQDKLDEQGVTAILVETLNDRGRLDRAHDFMTSRRVDALIVMSARESDQERLKELARDRPVILCVQGVPGTGIPSVTPDDYLGGVLAAGYLAQLGHKVVAQLSCEIDIVAFRSRRAGFEGRAAELGLTVVDTPHAAQTAGLEEGYKLMSMLLASAPVLPTGVFVHTDTMAIGALKALRATGLRCPEDISVVGFDDNPMSSYVEPPLTTIAFPAYDIGRDAAALALGILDGTALPPYSKIFRPEVVVRQSTGFAQVGPAQDA